MTGPDRNLVLTRAAAALILASIGAACSGADRPGSAEETGGTVVIATTSDPASLFPPTAINMESRQATELIYEYLADVGTGMNTVSDTGFVKEIASGWRWSEDSSALAFTLNPQARWHDGKPVTAHDVAFSFSIYTDTTISASTLSSLRDIDSVSVIDSSTAKFWFKRRNPRLFYEAASQMLILPSHILESVPRDSLKLFTASHPPIGSGKYQLASWNKGSSFELRALASHYRGRAGPERVIWNITPEYQ
ncbi:MAG: ABC transporter substrate-binding protein, partial [Thermoanaerobaculia bacterium]